VNHPQSDDFVLIAVARTVRTKTDAES